MTSCVCPRRPAVVASSGSCEPLIAAAAADCAAKRSTARLPSVLCPRPGHARSPARVSPPPRAIAIAMRRAIIGPLAVLGADQLLALGLSVPSPPRAPTPGSHQPPPHARPPVRPPRSPSCPFRQPVVPPNVEPSASPTILSTTVAGTTFRPNRTYTEPRDATRLPAARGGPAGGPRRTAVVPLRHEPRPMQARS